MEKKLNAKDLSEPRLQASFTDAEARAMKDDGKTAVKTFADKLDDDEISTVVAYVRGLKN